MFPWYFGMSYLYRVCIFMAPSVLARLGASIAKYTPNPHVYVVARLRAE